MNSLSPSRFFKQVIVLILLNLLIKPAWILFIDRQVQLDNGDTAYGGYFVLFNLSVVMGFMCDLGIHNWINRKRSLNMTDETDSGEFFSLKLLLVAIFLLLFSFTGIFILHQPPILVISVGLIQVFSSLLLFVRALITGAQLFHVDRWLSIADKSLLLLLLGILAWQGFTPGVTDYALFQAMALGLILAVSLLATRRALSTGFSRRFPARKQFKEVVPYGLIILLMAAHYRIDAVILERLHPEGELQAGVYAKGYRLLDAVNIGGYLFASFFFPYLTRLWSQKISFEAVIIQARHLLLVPSCFIAGFLFTGSSWFTELFYGTTDRTTAIVVQWCMAVFPLYAIMHIYGTILTATGHLRELCLAVLLALLLNIGLNIWLVPELGALGCCFAAVMSHGFCAFFVMYLVHQKTGISLKPGSLFIYIFIAMAAAFSWIINERFLHLQPAWILLIAGLFSLLLVLAGRLMKPAAWKNLIKSEPHHA